MIKRLSRTLDPFLLVVLCGAAIPVFLQFTGEHMPVTADGIFHTHRIHAMTTLMQSGEFYPRWIPWFHLGYGYPVFNFYAPLGTWLGGVLGVLGVSAPQAFQTISVVAWIIGAIGMYFLGKLIFPRPAALLTAILWLYAPTRMHEYWIQGSLPHVIGTALVPWVFFTLARAITYPSARTSAWFGLSLGALLLAHQPTTILMALYGIPFAISLLVYVCIHDRVRWWRHVIAPAMGAVLALGIAAIFLLPTLSELDTIVIDQIAAENIPVLVSENTLALSGLFQQPSPPDRTDSEATIPHTFGILSAVLAICGLVALLIRRKFAFALLLGAGVLMSVLLVLDISRPIWLNVPLLDQLRFPWRVLRIGIVPLALLGGASVLLLPRRWMLAAAFSLVALQIAVALPTIFPPAQMIDFTGLTAADAIRYEIASGAVGNTSYDEFRPVWAIVAPSDPPTELEQYADAPLRLAVLYHTADSLTRVNDACYDVRTAEGADITWGQFYFPGWQITLNDTALTASASEEAGLLRVHVPAGSGRLCTRYAGTPVEQIAPMITVAALFLTGVMMMRGVQPSHISRSDAETIPIRVTIIVCGLLLAFAAINAGVIAPRTAWFRVASPVTHPAEMQTPFPATFGDAYDLLGYTLPNTHVSADGRLEITLFWRARHDQYTTAHPRVQLVNLPLTEAWASREPSLIGTRAITHTPDQFISQTITLDLYDDVPPYVGQIRVELIDNANDTPLTTSDGQAYILLPQPILIDAPSPPHTTTLNYTIEDRVRLIDASVTRRDGILSVALVWQSIRPFPVADVRVFVHGLNIDGTLLGQADAPPLDGNYPVAYWQADQILTDVYTLPDDPQITQVAVGMHTPERRLTITDADGQIVADGRILLDSPLRSD